MFYHFVFFTSLFIGILLITALLSRKENRLSNMLLSGIVAAVLYSQWIIVLNSTGEIEHFPNLLRYRFPANLLIPSLFYLYIRSLTVPGFKWNRGCWIHLIPFLVGGLTCLGLLLFTEIGAHPGGDSGYFTERYILALSSVILGMAYFVPCCRQFRRFKKIIPYYFSNPHSVSLLWLRVLLVLYLIAWTVSLIGIVTGPFVFVEHFTVLAITISILFMGLFGVRQTVIFPREDF